MKFNENTFKQICDDYNFSCHITANEVTIKTLYATWKFNYTEKPYHLYHRPTILRSYKNSINANDGYHDQNRFFNDEKELVDYIFTHDNNLFTKKRPTNRNT